jgi:tetratricopeptide (TPR) repeat protein
MDTPLPAFDPLWDYDDPAATERLFRALLPAARAGADPAYPAELLTQIARAQGLQRAFAAAHRTLDAADRLSAAGPPRPRIRGLLERGRVFNSAGAPDDARPLFQAAYDLARAAGEDGLAVDAAHMLAIIAPPPEQLAWNLQALALAEQSAQPAARRWRGSLYNNIGWTHHDAGRYEDALAAFERALAARRSQTPPAGAEDIRAARWAVARALRSLGRLDAALAAQRALAQEYGALGRPSAAVDEEIAECLLAQGDPVAARPHFARAHALLAADPWVAENEAARLTRLRELGRPDRRDA